MSQDLPVAGHIVIPGKDLSSGAVRSSGPGGQNVNKVATKVFLRFDLEGSRALDEQVKARLRRLARKRIDAEGRLVITSQLTRNQARNLQDAKEKLARLVARALSPPKPRKPTRPTAASKKRRLQEKRRQSEKKARRTRVKESE
jgi:ribosome-associated protein